MAVTQYEDPTYLDAVYAALFALIKTATFPDGVKFQKQERISAWPDDFTVAEQPALYLVEAPVKPSQREVFGPVKWEFGAIIIICLRADKSDWAGPFPPNTLCNYFIWGIAKAFENTEPPYERQTLGGLVYHCWIDGEIRPEQSSEQVTIGIPIHILPGPSN